eukprot:gnl/Trimastix_PCT/89.p1 GENE.gnl/Trimastix_PCT/89~~gnl/Trimastix_PCT/89.p1  ORF type:complete len:152 (+),score=14.13 gnl/Trimastix_PCT/89:45-500(+)
MRFERCAFSWTKIYPGHGITYVRADGRQYTFSGSKPKGAFHLGRQSRKTTWTGEFRRIHKKDMTEEVRRRRKRRTVRYTKAIEGITLDMIRTSRAQKRAERMTEASSAALKEIRGRKTKTQARHSTGPRKDFTGASHAPARMGKKDAGSRR